MAVKPLHTESDLLIKVADGDQHAFKILYDRYNNKVYTHCVKLLHSPAFAEEVTQEIFLKLWLMGADLIKINTLEAYLKTITRNRCLNNIRRIVLEKKADVELTRNYVEEHTETEEGILLKDTRAVMDAAIALLPNQQKEIYLLCHNEGLKYEEVALRLNISVNTVKTHMKRALSSLRANLKDNTDIAVLLILFKLL